MRSDKDITYIAQVNFRHDKRGFGIRRKDRRSHMYLIGKTGTGKSTLLGNMVSQDIRNGEGLALLDPHGDLVEEVLRLVPEERRRDIIYFNVPDRNGSLSFNPLENVQPLERPRVASGLLDAFKKNWADSWGPRLEHILRNTFLTLLDLPAPTLADILLLLNDKDFRKSAVQQIQNEQVRQFWTDEYEKYTYGIRTQAIAPIQNKVGAFLADPVLNRILTQPKSSFDLRDVMDTGKVLLVNLAKGKIGEDSASLLGALLVSQIGTTGLSRADLPEETRRDFYLYLDEFQTFTTLSLAGMLSELRKYRVGLILANQYLSQIEPEVRDAILSNVGTLISFRLGPSDATFLAKEFTPNFSGEDLMGLPNHHIYLKMMIDGAVSKPFSALTLPPHTDVAVSDSASRASFVR